jgi:hypothetical protein
MDQVHGEVRINGLMQGAMVSLIETDVVPLLPVRLEIQIGLKIAV